MDAVPVPRGDGLACSCCSISCRPCRRNTSRSIRSARRISISWIVVLGLFGYMQGVLLYTVYQNVHAGASIDPGRGFFAGMFLFFALMGNQLGKVRKNFYIGVSVPWTLASDRVWNDTHRLAAWVMFASGAGRVHPDRLRRVDRHPVRPADRSRP